MLSNETSIPAGAIRKAINVDIDRYGNFSRRKGYAPTISGSFHSARSFLQKGWIMVVQGNTLQRFVYPTTLLDVYTLNSSDPVDYHEHNGTIYFSNKTTIGRVSYGDNVGSRIGVPVPGTSPSLTATTVGALVPGTYTIAFTFLDNLGQESGASGYLRIKLTVNGGIALSGLPTQSGYRLRVYMSAADGEVLRLNQEFNAVLSTGYITDFKEGKQLDTIGLTEMIPGSIVRGFNGRLYTCLDNVITFSEPLRYGATNLATNRIVLNDNITIFEPVLGGIYVGAGNKVWFMEGGDPSKFTQKLVSNCRAIPNSSTVVPGEHFDQKVVNSNYPVALWLSTSGYAVGLVDGTVIELQPDRVRIPGSQMGRTTFLLRNGMKQAITPVNSTLTASFGLADDSSTS